MSRIVFLMALALIALPISTGCGPSNSGTVVDSSDADAIAEYEAAIKAEEEAANASMEESVGN